LYDGPDDEGMSSHLVVNRARRTAMTASDSGVAFCATIVDDRTADGV